MRLVTLGGLELGGTGFRREKPLLVLACLALEGSQPRRALAELLWPGAADPLNSLAVALGKLRRLGAAGADEERAWPLVPCDAAELRDLLRTGRHEAAVEAYRGAFCDGLALALEPAAEEWVLETRERLAEGVREALLALAEREAAGGRFEEAGRRAEAAWRLPGAAPPEPQALARLHRLLLAAEHPVRDALEREARELGEALGGSPEAARGRLRRGLIGRGREVEALLAMRPGEWAWVGGGAGLGKTALLRELEARWGWRYLPARSGLPYATLEPLLGRPEGGEAALIRRLERLEGDLLVDGWEDVDPDARRLLERLRGLRPPARVVLAGRGEPPFPVDRRLDLGLLSEAALGDHPGAFEATGGVPALVGAWLRGEPLGAELGARLALLGEAASRAFAALALQDEPDLGAARRALGADAAAFASALEALLGAGLVEPSGRVRAREAALERLRAQPGLEAELALALAREVSEGAALPLYRRARALWTDADLPRAQRAYLAWGRELSRRGFPARAAEALAEAPAGPPVTALRARFLERAGLYREALETLRDAPESAELEALRGKLLWRLGQPEEAREAAGRAVAGPGMEVRAEALNTLGLVARSNGNEVQAKVLFTRAATLWRALGETAQLVLALNNLGIALNELGEDPTKVFQEAMETAVDDLTVRARVAISLGKYHERGGRLEAAEAEYRKAAGLAATAEDVRNEGAAWTNIGVICHLEGRTTEAGEAYRRGLELAQRTGDRVLTGTLLANLAELAEDLPAWEEAADFLEASGWPKLAARVRGEIEAFKGRSGGVAQAG